MIPHRLRTSIWSMTQFHSIRRRVGLAPNILARIAFLLSVRELSLIRRELADTRGQEFNAPTLFGEHQKAYELLLAKYIQVTLDQRDPSLLIAMHIEMGLQKMRHLRNLQDVVELTLDSERTAA